MCYCFCLYSQTVVLINLADKFIIFHAQCKLCEKSFRLIYKVALRAPESSYPKKQVFKLRVRSLVSKEAEFLLQLYYCIYRFKSHHWIVCQHPSNECLLCVVELVHSTAQNISLLGNRYEMWWVLLAKAQAINNHRDIHHEHFIWQSQLPFITQNEKSTVSAKFQLLFVCTVLRINIQKIRPTFKLKIARKA